MVPKLIISAHLLKRLERVKQQCSGCLFGVFYGDGTLLLMSFNLESTIGQLNYEQIQNKFPAELDLCGLVKFGDCSDAEAHLTEVFKDVDFTDNPILLHCELGTLVDLHASILMHGKLQPIAYKVMEVDELYRDFCFTRLKCELNLCTELTIPAVRHEMHQLRKMVSGGSLAFRLESSKTFITSLGIGGGGIGASTGSGDSELGNYKDETTINHLINSERQSFYETSISDKKHDSLIVDSSSLGEKKKRGGVDENLPSLGSVYGVVGSNYDVISIEVFRCKTRDALDSIERSSQGRSGSSSVPVRHKRSNIGGGSNKEKGLYPAISMCVRREEHKFSFPVVVDAMAMLSKSTKTSRLYDILIESICRHLRLCEYTMLERLEDASAVSISGDGSAISATSPSARMLLGAAKSYVLQSYHFLPMEFGHFLTYVYLAGVADDDASMVEKRKRLHRHFGLPITRPYFRRGNRCLFHPEIPANAPLLNTHIGVRPSGLKDSVQSVVQGNYFYYHYLQQNEKDKGWGCAYRSLQTLCSWFLLQGYTECAVPSLREIQEYLVRIGDKSPTFVGSTQWIGSTEVAMCLEGFLNVTSRIQPASSGKDLVTLGAELAVHFQTQGTPVMIGGGQLAHTILGVDYATQNGEIRFLILDPHYTGADDLHTIQVKGWCGWKGPDFWDKNSFYNLCLPQCPNIC